MNNKKINARKAQEEIVGFVLIVLLVSILIVVFLAIMLRSGNSESYKDSQEISEFVDSALEYTSECAINYEPDYSNLGELLADCSSGKKCLSGRYSCDVLNETLTNLIENSWRFGDERAIKGYAFNSSYFLNGSVSEEIVYLSRGNCTGTIRGGESLIPSYPGNIISRMMLCY